MLLVTAYLEFRLPGSGGSFLSGELVLETLVLFHLVDGVAGGTMYWREVVSLR